MPLKAAKVALKVQGGLSPVCATCDRFWEARERDIPGDVCAPVIPCGGPLVGRDFPDYRGPMTDLAMWCFVCGSVSDYGVQVGSRDRIVGICSQHVHMLDGSIGPDGDDMPKSKFVVKSKNGTLTVRQILGPEKKSLFKAIAEVEDYYAKKRG